MRFLRALLLPILFFNVTSADFTSDTVAAIQTLQKNWYNFGNGLW